MSQFMTDKLFAITVRAGAPIITDNIIRPRQDLEDFNLPGSEYESTTIYGIKRFNS